jgi:hypothetical protein
MILPFLLYNCETLSHTLGEENGLTEFNNRAFSGIFGPKRIEVTRGGRKLHDLYSSSNIIRMIKSRTLDGQSM